MGKHHEGRDEAILEPEIAIIDSHQHLFVRPQLRYLLDDYLRDVKSGHNVVASVYVETQSMARTHGPEWLRPVGEVEFANGMAAMSAGGQFGQCQVAAAIVGHVDLRGGDHVPATLDRMMSAAPDRFRGVRQIAMSHSDPSVLRFLGQLPPADLLTSSAFDRGLRHLAHRQLSFDATVLHHQLPDLCSLASRHPDLTLILDHMGLAVGMNMNQDERVEVLRDWRKSLLLLARHENVFCKVGGLGTAYWGLGFDQRTGAAGSEELAVAWQPYIDTAIGAFGPQRCMLESNYPADGRSCGFVPLWNAFKRILRDYSAAEKADLFHGTAARVYRICPPQFQA